jgi:DNA-binding transcriptional LysR family regulator
METLKLKHFCVVCETQSLTRSADLLGISHSGLHKSLRTLEDELGFSLTVQDGRGIQITEAGRNFYSEARDIVDRVDKLKNRAALFNKVSFKIAMTEVLSLALFRSMFEELENLRQGISCHERCPGEMEPQIAAGDLDFGFTNFPMAHSGVEQLKIVESRMGLFGLKQWQKLPLGELTYVRPNSLLGTFERDHWKEEIFERKSCIRVNMLSIALDLVKSGQGVVFIPTFIAASLNRELRPAFQLHEIDLPKDLQVSSPLFLVKRVASEETTLMKKVCKIIRTNVSGNQ